MSEKIIGVYAAGMTVRDIRDQLASWYGVDVSRDTISVCGTVLGVVPLPELPNPRPAARGS